MTSLADALHDVDAALGAAVATAFRSGDLGQLDDDGILDAVARAASMVRRAEALLVATVAEVQERMDAAPPSERLTTRYGCRSARELVQRATRLSGRTVGDALAAASAVRRRTSLSGETLPAEYPAMRDAAADGVVGLDALVAVTGVLGTALCDRAIRDAAERELATSARGAADDDAPPATADDLRLQARVWAMYLDQDGAEPREERALRKRTLTLGVCRDGLVPCRGDVLPEVAAQLQRLFDSILNPKVEGRDETRGPWFSEGDDVAGAEASADPRTRAMRQHDALATILGAAARSGELPTIGGSAPTLVVSVDARDLVSGRGFAHVDGVDEPVALAVARHVACSGAVQRVTTGSRGRILAIDISDRVFAAHQRRAIALRDGGCVIPGCRVPAPWCEIHHVDEHARGGGTHTDNGVLLCWHHHRTLDSSGWEVRMLDGLPEVRGPSWWDASRRWRATTTSPVRLKRRLLARRPS